MIQHLITLIAGGAVAVGLGTGSAFVADLTDVQQAELSKAKETAVEVLTTAEKDVISSLDGKTMRDLTIEQKQEVRAIKDKLRIATEAEITDPELKKELVKHHEERMKHRADRQASRQNHSNR